MSKPLYRCDHCAGKFGLVSHSHFGRRFCRKACKQKFAAKRARERDDLVAWLSGFAPLTSR